MVVSAFISLTRALSGEAEAPNLSRSGNCLAVLQFVGVVVCLLFVDRWGRRFLLLSGTAGTLLCHLLMAVSGVTGCDDFFCVRGFVEVSRAALVT